MSTQEATHFIQALIIGAVYCIGIHVVVKNIITEVTSYISFDVWLDNLSRHKKLLLKPLFACPYCMASVHGSVIFFILYPVTGIILWLPFCICLCGLNYFLTQFFVE